MSSMDYRIPANPPASSGAAIAPPLTRSIRPYLMVMMLATLGLSVVVKNPTYSTAGWLTALALGAFVLALQRPVWLLLPIIITELTLYSYTVPTLGMAQRLVVILLATLLAIPALGRWARFSDLKFRRVLLPALSLVVLATILNSMYSMEDYVFKYLRFQIGQVLALVLAASLIRSRDDLLWMARITLGVGVVTGFVAIWQHFAPTTALYGFGSPETIGAWKGRSIGFMNSPIALANQLIFVLAPLLGVLLVGAWRFDRLRLILGFATFLVFAGLTFSYTRSAFFALGPGLIVMGMFLRGQRRVLVIGAMVAAITFFPLLETTGLLGHRYFRDADEDRSAATHEALWEVGLAMALDNAILGIGHEHFEEVALDYTDAINEDARAISGAEAIGDHRPHNDFLSVWMAWGIFALIAYLAIFAGALRNFIIAARHHDLLIRGLAVGCVGGLIVYGINSAYHNSMDSSVFLWLYAGFSVALARLATSGSGQHAGASSPPLNPRGGSAR